MNTIMREEDFDHLFRQLCHLRTEAPCRNGEFGKHCQRCAYCCYSGECAIDIVRTEAEHKYKEYTRQYILSGKYRI